MSLNIDKGDNLRFSYYPILFFICYFSLLGANINAAETEPIVDNLALGELSEKQVAVSLVARHFDESRIDRASLFGPHINFSGAMYLSPKQSFIFNLKGVQEFGSSQTRFGENVPSNGIYASQAYINIILSRWHLDVGIINQSWLSNELLFSSQPFPAIRTKYHWRENDSFKTALFFQLAMPTTTRIKTRTGVNQSEPYSLVAGVDHQRESGKWLAKSKLYYYSIEDLPSEVAVESARFGNTVLIPTVSTARFTEDFSGLSLVIDLEYLREEYSLLLNLKTIKNLATKSGFGFGQVAELGAKYLFKDQLQTAKLIYFFNESDTSVASFNSYEYGHSNRVGYGLSLHHQLKPQLEMGFNYIESDTINDSTTQNSITFWNFVTTWHF